jgi:hypothetical protein
MLDSLENKLQKFDPKRPYVWELKITENEFHDLEDNVKASSLDASERSDALKIVVYMAEWYKRGYTNSSKKGYQSVFGGKAPDLEQAWDTLEINKRYLYRSVLYRCLKRKRRCFEFKRNEKRDILYQLYIDSVFPAF